MVPDNLMQLPALGSRSDDRGLRGMIAVAISSQTSGRYGGNQSAHWASVQAATASSYLQRHGRVAVTQSLKPSALGH
jgi:hypothetical protein